MGGHGIETAALRRIPAAAGCNDEGRGDRGRGTVVAQGGLPAGDAALDAFVADQRGVEARATEDLGGRFAVAVPTDTVALEGVIVDDATAAHAIHGRQGFMPAVV